MNGINPFDPRFDHETKIVHFSDAALEKRRRIAIISTISTLGLIVILAGLQVPDLAKLLIFIPAFFSGVSIYQVVTKFSIPFDFERQLTGQSVKRVWNVIAWSLIGALVLTVLSMLLS